MFKLLSKQHNDWIRIAYNLTENMDEAKDLVQEAYLAVLEGGKSIEEITYKDQINRYYMWKLIRSLFIDNFRKRNSKKFVKTCELIGDDINTDYTDYDNEEDLAFETVSKRVKDITSKWRAYDRKLFDLYFMKGLSLRKIANGTGIGLNSIHNSVKSYREALREELSEDLMDYFNGDYDKIN